MTSPVGGFRDKSRKSEDREQRFKERQNGTYTRKDSGEPLD